MVAGVCVPDGDYDELLREAMRIALGMDTNPTRDDTQDRYSRFCELMEAYAHSAEGEGVDAPKALEAAAIRIGSPRKGPIKLRGSGSLGPAGVIARRQNDRHAVVDVRDELKALSWSRLAPLSTSAYLIAACHECGSFDQTFDWPENAQCKDDQGSPGKRRIGAPKLKGVGLRGIAAGQCVAIPGLLGLKTMGSGPSYPD
jgi:hypothetical protein